VCDQNGRDGSSIRAPFMKRNIRNITARRRGAIRKDTDAVPHLGGRSTHPDELAILGKVLSLPHYAEFGLH
jgi:hypothetical protein